MQIGPGRGAYAPLNTTRNQLSFAVAIALVASAATFVFDISTPRGIAAAMPYVVVMALGAWLPKPRWVVAMALVLGALTAGAYLLKPSGPHEQFGILNRILTLCGIAVTAGGVVWKLRLESRVAMERARQGELLNLGVAIVALDMAGRVSLVNRAGCELLGLPESEILGQDWVDRFVPEAERVRVHEALAQVRTSGRTLIETTINPILAKSGVREVAWYNLPRLDEEGRVIGTISSGSDVSEQARAEKALKRTYKDLADINYALDQSAIVAVTDAAGTITYVNDRFCEISKFSREELLGRNHRVINSGTHSRQFFEEMWRTIAAGKVWRGEVRNRAKDGSHYWVDTTIIPFVDDHGQPFKYLAIRSDITARKAAEQKVAEQAALARLGEMAAVVAHEVKNPLAGIGGALQIIGSRMPAGSEDRLIVNDMLDRIKTLDLMVRDLLVFARPRPLRRVSVEISQLLRDTASLLTRNPEYTQVEVHIDAAEGGADVDAEQLRGVLLNLLLNAAQAMNAKGRIEVQALLRDSRWIISISDQGPGVSPEAREKLFQPFFTTKHRGTGLGLAIAKRVIEGHGGRIELQWPAGGGTRAVVTIPASGE